MDRDLEVGGWGQRGRQERLFGNPYLRALVGTGRLLRSGVRRYGNSIINAATYSARGRTPISPPPSPGMRSVSRGRKRARSGSARRRVSRSRSRSSSLGVTTEQRDSSIRYVSRRGSRGGRRRRAFARRVQNVFLRLGALQTFSDLQNASKTVTVAQQQWDGFIVGGTTVTDDDHFFKAFQLAYGAGLTTSTVDDYSLYIKTICCDFQFTNTGTTTLIFDFHSLMSRKSYNVAEQLAVMLATLIAETPAQSGYSFTSTDPGYSIFQVPMFCQYWKIMRKWQVQLGAGETTTLQIRIPVNRMIRGKLIETNPQAIPRLSRGLLWSVKGAPYLNVSTPTTAAGTYVWCSQTTISYQIPPSSTRLAVAITA